MLEFLFAIDKAIVLFLNGINFKLLDYFMWFVSFLGNYAAIWILLAFFALFKDKKKGNRLFFVFLFSLLIVVLLTDGIAKNVYFRERPYEAFQGMKIIGSLPADSSFPSSHAAVAFLGAVVFSYFYRKFKIYLYTFAVLAMISRVYLAVHYPSDVIVGAILGYAVGMFMIFVYKRIQGKNLQRKAMPSQRNKLK